MPAYVCSMDGCKKVSRVHCYQCNKVFCFSLINDKESSGMGGSSGMVTGDTDSSSKNPYIWVSIFPVVCNSQPYYVI
jgi:hypothetical protein